MIVCACVDMCLRVLFVLHCVLFRVCVVVVIVRVCLDVFGLFVIYCAVLCGLGVVD